MERIVMLCDYGLDDMCATLYLLENTDRKTPVDIVAVGGNDSADKAYANAEKLISNLDFCGNITLVDTRAQEQNCAYLPSIHGKDSMGDLLEKKRLVCKKADFSEWLDTLDCDITLVSLGPCTITEKILERVGEVKKLVIMGGCVAEVPNFNGLEFNHAINVDAFARCVKYPHVIATLDSCRHPAFNFANKVFEGKSLLARALNRSIELAVARHKDNSFVYDYICVDYLIHPDKWIVEEKTDPLGNVLNQLRYIG